IAAIAMGRGSRNDGEVPAGTQSLARKYPATAPLVFVAISTKDGIRSTKPSCNVSAHVDKHRPNRKARFSDEPPSAIPKGKYSMTLLVMSERSNASMMYLSEGCLSFNGIMVAATI